MSVLVASQQLKPTTFNRHLVRRAQRKAVRKRALIIGLTLTSMVDMFSLLVIFLLQTFSASPEMIVAKGMVLPQAHTALEVRDAPILTIASDELYLDQKRVGGTQDVLHNPEPLMARLADLRERWQKSHPGQSFKGEINLQAHRDTPSTVVSQIMAMLPSQNYGSIQLAVLMGGKQ